MARLRQVSPKITTSGERKSPLGWLNKLLLITVSMLIVFEALITNAKASNGSKLAELQQQYDSLNAEITTLELQVASRASLSQIKHQAQDELKMQPVDKNVLYLSLPTDGAIAN